MGPRSYARNGDDEPEEEDEEDVASMGPRSYARNGRGSGFWSLRVR